MNWARLRESSLAIRLWRATMSHSVVVNAIRSFAGPQAFFGRDVQRVGGSFDDERVVTVIDDSWIVHLALAPLRALDRGWDRSNAARLASALRRQMMACPLSWRIRLSALAFFSAVVVRGLLTSFSALQQSVWARGFWIVIAILLAAVIVGARGVAAAWIDWSGRRPNNEGERP